MSDALTALTFLLDVDAPRRGYSKEENLSSEDEDETPILNDENTVDTDESLNSTITKSAESTGRLLYVSLEAISFTAQRPASSLLSFMRACYN
uniref:Uncharacterized protein n=1 Tax=Timema poppense TaxID=170557 RepID=A0A7R9DEG6_TIMPO|nr:unnamed protein product [Timema poppensis]